MGDKLIGKGLVIGIIVLLIAMSFGTSTGRIDIAISRTTFLDGSLLGYVNDTSGNPIVGALVRVYFHGTYEENYSDENGYYHVTNIPICYCLKNATCSKDGYITEWVLLSITENTTHDFVLMPNHPPSAPTITGPINGKIGIAYTFQFNAVDPDNDNIKYEIKWGDGKEEVTDFYPSGEIVSVKHVWNKIGTYLIMARAQDEYGLYSAWATPPIPITITKNKDKAINILIQNLIQQYSTAGSQQSFSVPSSQNIMSVIPTVERANYVDDTTPPITTHELVPSVPDGDNDWYISDVNVTLNATDDISGVKEIKYKIDGDIIQTISGNTGTFAVTTDSTMHIIKYWAIDNAGNEETQNTINFRQDQTRPKIELTYEWSGDKQPYLFTFNATARDTTSGMERVEIWRDRELQKTIVGPGPYYIWEVLNPYSLNKFNVRGLIRNLEITDEYARFYAIIVKIIELYNYKYLFRAYAYDNAGNWDYDDIVPPSLAVTIEPGFYLFENLTLPKNYTGYIGRYFIWATFSNP